MVTPAYNISTWEAEAGGSHLQNPQGQAQHQWMRAHDGRKRKYLCNNNPSHHMKDEMSLSGYREIYVYVTEVA